MHFHGPVDDVMPMLCHPAFLMVSATAYILDIDQPWSEGVAVYVPAENSSTQIAHVIKYNDPQSFCPCKWPPNPQYLNPLCYHP